MIRRYSRPEMAELWSDRNRYLNWLKVEEVVCEDLAKEGVLGVSEWRRLKNAIQKLRARGGVNPERVEEIESKTRHDVIAFVEAVSEEIGPDARFVHFGLTSSDVVDTALALNLVRAGELIRTDVLGLLEVLKKQAWAWKDLPTIGRSHGMFAEPTSFGLKFLGWYTEWMRNLERLEQALDRIAFGKLSGAVGASSHFSPKKETQILKALRLKREAVSTQVIPRDRLAELMNVFALMGGSLERIALELRHLQRSEVGEVREGFARGQKGSSAMPHKRNPISSENLTGAARMLRGYAQMCLENVALWHERDISHSAVERVAVADAFILLDYALARMTSVLANLEVLPDRVKKNLEAAGPLVFSGHYLLALVQKGVRREQAYEWVQACALKSMDEKKDFRALLERHPEVSARLKKDELKKLGTLDYQLRHVGEIFREVLGSGPKEKKK